MTVAPLVVLGAAAAALLLLRLPVADRFGRWTPALALPAPKQVASRVVDDLIRAARTEERRIEKRGVEMASAERRMPDVADEPIAREVRTTTARQALKARPDGSKLKRAADGTNGDWTERDDTGRLLKADVQAVKLKQEDGPSATLKERLAPPEARDATALKRSAKAPAVRPLLGHEQHTPELRPVGDAGRPDRRVPRVAARPVRCEIRRWRGYVTSQFCAVATDTDGAETILRTSPSFRSLRAELPETPAAAAALRALVVSLEEDGWRVAGQEDEWFAMVLLPRAGGGAAGGNQ
jgi:hypothetical protein